eukprot:1554724-Prymnesium_polylepis.1
MRARAASSPTRPWWFSYRQPQGSQCRLNSWRTWRELWWLGVALRGGKRRKYPTRTAVAFRSELGRTMKKPGQNGLP